MIAIVRKALVEAVSTFVFVFTVIGVVNSADPLGPLAIGLALTVLVYAAGHLSGAHLNPAVSLGVLIRGGLDAASFPLYLCAQFVGATLAASASLVVWPFAPEALAVREWPAFLVECLVTFVLVWVVLNVATSKDHPTNSFYGLAIGGTVFVGAVAVGGISGGAFNPAVAFGLALTGHFGWGSFWVYLIAPLLGAALAAGLFRTLCADEFIGTGASSSPE
ncbi:MIP/aquaporin family protein [Microbacterium resistens]|uniref:MIP/aquaporin family protein n=1 Tax=Microbacterium resistens TaxID=156977 RepID=UPI000832A852|nr:aquaporin [Microbacterium resistens]